MNDTIRMDILTRVEGHASVELQRQGERVVGARLRIHEAPRLFEALLVGRRCDEIADIVCRVCSICSTVHKVAALQAVEQAQGISVSRQTDLLRQLAVQGGQIESHALHVFCLALPDYLEAGGFPALAKLAPQRLQQGLAIKAVGNLIQEVVGGRAIHPCNLLLGGMGAVPGRERLLDLAEKLNLLHDEMDDVIRFVCSLPQILPPLPPLPFCCARGESPLFGDRLETSTRKTIATTDAAGWLNEQVEAHSFAKISRFDGTGIFIVGPLARLNLDMPAGSAALLADAPITASMLARGIELQLAIQRAIALIDRLLLEKARPQIPAEFRPSSGAGIALLEAPRGLLLHSYNFDDGGICTSANIITPTAINQAAMEFSLKALVAALDGAPYERVKTSAEQLVRCFDPCISCAVH